MRLYINTKEVPVLKSALQKSVAQSADPIEEERLYALLERIELCEALQKSERRAKKEEETNND